MDFRQDRTLSGRGRAPEQFAETLRGVAVDANDNLYAVGDAAVKVFDPGGRLLRQWSTALPGFCVAADDRGVYVGQSQQMEIFSSRGEPAGPFRDPGRLGLVTAIGLFGDDFFLADAHARCIRRYDRAGSFRNNIGDRHRKGGFHIPNGVVDFAVTGDGILHVANPGMHRVERYTADGELLGHFGRFDGVDPQGFGGCCNPTNLAVDRAGRIVVSEKAGPRAKVYDPEGNLLTVVADSVFDPNAKNMDLAVDSHGRIFVVDTARLEIFVFTPTEEVAA